VVSGLKKAFTADRKKPRLLKSGVRQRESKLYQVHHEIKIGKK